MEVTTKLTYFQGNDAGLIALNEHVRGIPVVVSDAIAPPLFAEVPLKF
ncbi:hypothetical protein [uncultured Rhodoblastus sp.]|nr:hypothetical protein [uncultured Rhodoblastus sp.]